MAFSGDSGGKESTCNVGDPGSIPGLGRSPAEGNGNTIPAFLPGEFQVYNSLMGYCPWDRKDLGMTERLTITNQDWVISIVLVSGYMM